MKVNIAISELRKAAAQAMAGVARKSTIPILTCLLLQAEESGVVVSGTDLSVFIRARAEGQVDSIGSVALPASTFSDLLKALPAEQASLSLKDKRLKMKVGRHTSQIKGLDPEEFPLWPGDRAGAEVSLPESFAQAVENVCVAAATDEARPVLQGILLHLEGRRLTLVAADGFVLAKQELELAQEPESLKLLVPAKHLAEVAKQKSTITLHVLKNEGGDATAAMFSADGTQVAIQLIEGTYPDWTAIRPNSHETKIVCQSEAFSKALKTSAVFSRDVVGTTRLKMGETSLQIAARSSETGDSESEVVEEYQLEGKPLQAAFKGQYLAHAVSSIGAPRFSLAMAHKHAPALLEPVGQRGPEWVVMPMTLDK